MKIKISEEKIRQIISDEIAKKSLISEDNGRESLIAEIDPQAIEKTVNKVNDKNQKTI